MNTLMNIFYGKDKNMNKEDFKIELKRKANKLDIELNEKQLEQFYLYKEMLVEWNEKVNLTAITEDEEIIDKHFVDSLTIAKFLKENKSIIDIGTGAGFPGIPLQIVNDKHVMTLFDSLQKRLTILDEITNKLQLENITTLHGRAEETFRNKQYREMFDIATSRAVANLSTLAEYMLPAVKIGGYCICMKGNNVEEEIKTAEKAISLLGGSVERVEKITLPETNIQRNIVIIRKEKATPKQYPRKAGTPLKDPIH